MHDKQVAAPDNTAVRVALWRALHVEVDSAPHVFEDEVGLKLAAPDDGWRSRPDMSPFTRPFRASIVARARFIEDLVAEQAARGVGQYVILGAGLDTFAQRRPELASRLLVFEIDPPGPQAWKRQRLVNLGQVGEVSGQVGEVSGFRFALLELSCRYDGAIAESGIGRSVLPCDLPGQSPAGDIARQSLEPLAYGSSLFGKLNSSSVAFSVP